MLYVVNAVVTCQKLQALFWLLQLCLFSCSLCHVHFLFIFLSWLAHESITVQDILSGTLIMHDFQPRYYVSRRIWCRAWSHSSSILNYSACAFLYYLSSFGYLFANGLHKRDKSSQSHSHLGTVGVESRSWGEEKKTGRLVCHLTDEYIHVFGHLAGAERITGRGSGTSSSRPATGKSQRKWDEDEAFI